jgi:hypothetical protein
MSEQLRKMVESHGACEADWLNRGASARSWHVDPIGACILHPAWHWLAEPISSLASAGHA